MRLTSGTRHGPYDILAPLGAGGGRGLPRARHAAQSRRRDQGPAGALRLDAERLARFTREAQTLAAQNHSNIAQIYGLEHLPPKGGSHVSALVMELVEGEDLSAVIARPTSTSPQTMPFLQKRFPRTWITSAGNCVQSRSLPGLTFSLRSIFP